MRKTYTPEQWHALAIDIHNLIMDELDTLPSEWMPQAYPKLIVMYEFFRLLRGEAFMASRPSGLGESQRDLYAKEDGIAGRLKAIAENLDPNDASTKFYLDAMKKSFDLQ